ncbi:Quinone oxidoreductase-like protein 2 [Escovopsis weberi]|uniref:Quinone oxidoreductase-like protein 2 n=1 Tax=Escovopsis weberi TaxID=150374 RepID=A0A0M8NAI8_ESCWE|nr:Quinone oxidoreductase-like protein 2 [Escovopsis weberi]
MKAVVINEFRETLEEVAVSDIPRPESKAGDFTVKVIAAGVNFVDFLYARGKHQNNKTLVRPPFILGIEFAGIVVSAPPNAEFRNGDAVLGSYYGTFAEFITIPAAGDYLHRMPPGWNFTEAASLGATLPVSHGALVLAGRLRPGETVLVHSAAGGLGVMAVQVAAAMGCRVIGTAGSDEKCAYARSFGAGVCLNYNDESWPKRVLEETGGRGVDLVYDPVGLVDLSLKCIAHRARVLVVGFVAREGQMEKIAMNRVLLKQASLIGYLHGESLKRYPEEMKTIWPQLDVLLGDGKIKPTVGRVYQGLESVAQALADLSNRKILGKAVIEVSRETELGAESKL